MFISTNSFLVNCMHGQDPQQCKIVCKEENDDKLYQGAVLHAYTTTMLKQCTDQPLADVK